MKRLIATAVVMAMLVGLSALAVCGPYFGIENVGLTANPEFIAGCDLSGRLGTSDWLMTVDGWYTNPNILDNTDASTFDLDVSLGWVQVATINQTGSLIYGCDFSIAQTVAFEPLSPGDTLDDLALAIWLMDLRAEGYVGPFSAWIGCGLDLLTDPVGFVPTVGFLVDW